MGGSLWYTREDWSRGPVWGRITAEWGKSTAVGWNNNAPPQERKAFPQIWHNFAR